MNRFFISTVYIALFLLQSIMAQTFTIDPDKPLPGEIIKITFDPTGTVLANADKIELQVYTYNKDLTDKKSDLLKKEGKKWTGSFTAGGNDLGAVIIFKSGEIFENNKQKGYVVHLYDKSGKILPGSLAGLGNGYFTWLSWYAGFDRNAGTALEFMEKEFVKYPDIKSEFVKYYIPAASAMNKERTSEIIKENAFILGQKKDLTDDDYLVLADLYGRLKDSIKTKKYEDEALQKFPDGVIAQVKAVEKINMIVDTEEKIQAAGEFAKKFPDSRYLSGLHNSIIKKYMASNEFIKLRDFMINNSENIDVSYFPNIALQMLEKKADLNLAYDIASAGVDIVVNQLQSEEKPEYYAESEWSDVKEERIGQCLYSKGRILYEIDKKSEALDILRSASEKMKYGSTEVNFYYAQALYDLKKYDELFNAVSGFTREGNSSEEMSVLLKKSYIEVKGTEDGYKEYLSELEEKANKKLSAKLISEMINEQAPLFKLANLEDNQFSLDELKGKIVIIDFWATWCGPCKSSFPGLKKIVKKYSGNKDVVFLFINSWERVDNKKENAQKFITDNGYPFNVLLDLDNQVIEKYKVSGIPTKFIIDKKGNIRFKSVGYSGDNNKMIAEINAMISLLNDYNK